MSVRAIWSATQLAEDLLDVIDRLSEYAHTVQRVGVGYYSISNISFALGQGVAQTYLLIIP